MSSECPHSPPCWDRATLVCTGECVDPRPCPECGERGHHNCPAELPEGGYCFECRIGFDTEAKANAHYALTGHAIGYPFEDVDWPLATNEQIYPSPFYMRGETV